LWYNGPTAALVDEVTGPVVRRIDMTDQEKSNAEIAQVFSDIADMLDIKGEDWYRIRAYRRAAETIAHYGEDLSTVWQEGRLEEMPGVGKAIATKIDEMLSTGQMEYYERLKSEIPDGVLSLLGIPGVGPRTVELLYKELGLVSIPDVETAALQHRLRDLKGLGAKSEERILQGIQSLHRVSGRHLLATALPVAEEIVAALEEHPEAHSVTPAGSLRRCAPTVGDIDILAASDSPEVVVQHFVSLPQVAEVRSQGDTKGTVYLHNGLQVDLMVLEEDRYGSLLQHFTGSKDHNAALRGLARRQGLSLSEYGFQHEDGTITSCATEEEVYATLGLDWIPPELREDRGEVDAAREGRLPNLVTLGEIKGDFHAHTVYSDGASTIKEMAAGAMARGYEYLAITDHSQGLGVAGGLSPDDFARQWEEISQLNQRSASFRLLSGVELEIRTEGDLDFPDEILERFDVVVASVHLGLRQDKEQITKRTIAAMRNPHVDVIGHPTGRLLGRRESMQIDLEAVLEEAAKTGTMLEVNAQPNRLDLGGDLARRAIAAGAMLALGSDAHHADGLGVMRFGVATARRGWAQPANVANCLSCEELLARLKRAER
jgi:DNA polymerase (family 10)